MGHFYSFNIALWLSYVNNKIFQVHNFIKGDPTAVFRGPEIYLLRDSSHFGRSGHWVGGRLSLKVSDFAHLYNRLHIPIFPEGGKFNCR
jgi:hypothetical protein